MAWDFMAPVRNIELGAWLATFLESLDHPDYLQMFPLQYAAIHRPSNAYTAREATLHAPRVLKCDMVEGTMFLLQGVKRTDTALSMFTAWGENPDLSKLGGANSQVYRAADELYMALSLSGANLAHNVILAGHSFGGAVAQALAAMILDIFPAKRVRVVSYGSPRVGPNPWRQATNHLDHARYWSVDDPICFCPPRRVEAYNGHALMTRNVSNRWDLMVQTGTGIMLQNGALATLQDYTVGPPEYTELNLIGWATGLMLAPVIAHSIREYRVRLWLSKDASVTFDPAPAGGYHRPTGAPPTSPPIPTTPPPAMVAAVAAVDTALGTLRTVPDPHVFQAEHLYGVWGVYRGVECITVCTNRSRARRLANVGNQMLRQATARGVNHDAKIAEVLAGML